mgnify:CR=1 FL=1
MSAVAHFFVVVCGSKIHERAAHFFIDIYKLFFMAGLFQKIFYFIQIGITHKKQETDSTVSCFLIFQEPEIITPDQIGENDFRLTLDSSLGSYR